MRPLRKLVLAVTVTLAAAPCIQAAELGQQLYDSYRDMHQQTQYGSLFFNEGAIRVEQSKAQKRFRPISGDGDLQLPSQQGYCFVFNHYGSPSENSVQHTYQGKISKDFVDGRHTEQIVKRTFTPATRDWSSDLPDLCVAGIRNVSKVAIAFSSDDDTYFDWNISFVIK